ncbi:hypothetical protein ACFX12_028983 [Malus domestica]
MLRQFPLICDAYLSDTIYDYKDGIYTYEMNRQGENLELHAMVLVGWGYNREVKHYYNSDVQLGDKWGQGGFGLMEKRLIRRVYYPTILPPDELPPDEI